MELLWSASVYRLVVITSLIFVGRLVVGYLRWWEVGFRKFPIIAGITWWYQSWWNHQNQTFLIRCLSAQTRSLSCITLELQKKIPPKNLSPIFLLSISKGILWRLCICRDGYSHHISHPFKSAASDCFRHAKTRQAHRIIIVDELTAPLNIPSSRSQ